MTREDIEKGKELLKNISYTEQDIKDMEYYLANNPIPEISFGTHMIKLDKETAKSIIQIMISDKKSDLKNLQKQFDEL